MADSPAPTVLIVDDDTFARALLRDCLADLPLRPVEVGDPADVLALVSKERPRIILLDLFMPKTSGLELIPRILELQSDARIVVVSSMDSESIMEEALALGAVGYITKPFHPLEIDAVLRPLLA